MGTKDEQPDGVQMSTLLWYAIFVWFASSLFSQSLYMAFNGVPYDAVALLQNLGPIYYLVFGHRVGCVDQSGQSSGQEGAQENLGQPKSTTPRCIMFIFTTKFERWTLKHGERRNHRPLKFIENQRLLPMT